MCKTVHSFNNEYFVLKKKRKQNNIFFSKYRYFMYEMFYDHIWTDNLTVTERYKYIHKQTNKQQQWQQTKTKQSKATKQNKKQ